MVIGADRSSFALHEARWTYRILRIPGQTSRSITEALEPARRPDGVVIGWTLNELDDEKRDRIAARLLPWVAKGTRLLVIEPVSKRVTPWWDGWVSRFPRDRCSVIGEEAAARSAAEDRSARALRGLEHGRDGGSGPGGGG